MLVHACRRESGACENQCKRESGEAFENQACCDGQLRNFPTALRFLLHDLPEKESCDRSWGKAPPEQMDDDDRRDCEQREKTQRRGETHSDSRIPAVASAFAVWRSGVP